MVLPRIPPVITRLRVQPDEPTEGPPAIEGYRPPGKRRMHSDLTVAKVRPDLVYAVRNLQRPAVREAVAA